MRRRDVSGARNDRYDNLLAALAVAVRCKSPPRAARRRLAGPGFGLPAFVGFDALQATASLGTPANPALPSANTGQTITLVGRALHQWNARAIHGTG